MDKRDTACSRKASIEEIRKNIFFNSFILIATVFFLTLSSNSLILASCQLPIWWHLSVAKLRNALTEAHNDTFCMRLYTSRPKMSVYQTHSAWRLFSATAELLLCVPVFDVAPTFLVQTYFRASGPLPPGLNVRKVCSQEHISLITNNF